MLNEILKILEDDARTTTRQLSRMTSLPVPEVRKLIKQAEKERTILKYKTVINWDRVGEEQVWALIEVRISPQKDYGFDAIAEHVYRFPQARTVYLISGTYDLMVMAVCPSMQDVADFISQKLAPIEGVQATVTHFVLKRYKEDNEIIQGNEEVRREPVIF